MPHWLTPLLSPKSIAIIGVSEREGNLAAATFRQLRDTGYSGELFVVNPGYDRLFEQTCYASLSLLPKIPELVVYGTSGLVLEQSFDEAISLKVGGIVIYASNNLEEHVTPRLTDRLRLKATQAGIPVCGGNSMGFYNYDDNVMVSFDQPPADRPAGHIGLIVHSGSGMTYLANNESRFCFNFVIASAQETNATVADYMDFLLDQSSTRVIALFLESVRDVAGFVSALEKARFKDIPVVITKLGRTEISARLALSHSGAIVGDHQAFIAACQRHGVILTRDADELIVTAMLFASGRRVQNGDLSSMLDSGGMREQMIDLADDYDLSFADITPLTREKIQSFLEYGLSVDNPLDAMGALGRNTITTYLECGKALLDDANTGMLTFEFEFRDGFSHYPGLIEVAKQLSGYSDKPLVLLNSFTYTKLVGTAAELTQAGIPVINGIDVALRAIRNFSRYRNPGVEDPTDQAGHKHDVRMIQQWKDRLEQWVSCDEFTSLCLMSDFNLPVVSHIVAEELKTVLDAANRTGYPLVMKTAQPGIYHKSDCNGVVVSIQNANQLEKSYRDLEARLGKRVLIMPMITSGIEVSVGMKKDPHYGPLLIVAAGGIFIELLDDRVFKLAPVNLIQAIAMINSLEISKMLKGLRGNPAVDIESLANLIVSFSQMVQQLSEVISEIDLNPVIVNESGCFIVDALVVPASSAE